MSTSLLDSINALLVTGQSEAISAATMRQVAFILAEGTVSTNDVAEDPLKSITESGMYYADATTLSDTPQQVSSGTVIIRTTKIANGSVSYDLIDTTNGNTYFGYRLINGDIVWKYNATYADVATKVEGNLEVYPNTVNKMVFKDNLTSYTIEDGAIHSVSFVYASGEGETSFDDNGTALYEDTTATERPILKQDGTVLTVAEFKVMASNQSILDVQYDAALQNMYVIRIIQNTSLGVVVTGEPMTDVEIKEAYERNADTNPFTDADKAKLDGLAAGTVPASYPKGIIGIDNAQNIDAISSASGLNINFTGEAGRLYRAKLRIYFETTNNISGEVVATFGTYGPDNSLQVEYTQSLPVFDTQLSASGRSFTFIQDFAKSDAGFMNLSVYLAGTWSNLGAYHLEVSVEDVGLANPTPPPNTNYPPIITSSRVEQANPNIVIATANMPVTASGTAGITVSNNTVTGISFNGNDILITVGTNIVQGETVTWSYDSSITNSDLRSVDSDLELLTDTFTVVNQINSPPVSTPVDLGTMYDNAGALTITEAQLLANATDPDGDTMTVNSVSITSGLGSVTFTNPDWEYTQVGVTSVTFTYNITDGINTITNTATLEVIASVNEMSIVGTPSLGYDRRVDVVMDEDMVDPSTSTIANAGFSVSGGHVIRYVTLRPSVPNELYITIDPPAFVAGETITVTYTKANASSGGEVKSVTGKDFPDGTFSVNNNL